MFLCSLEFEVPVLFHMLIMIRYWLGEFFNRMEAYPRFLNEVQKRGLMQACEAWSGFLAV